MQELKKDQTVVYLDGRGNSSENSKEGLVGTYLRVVDAPVLTVLMSMPIFIPVKSSKASEGRKILKVSKDVIYKGKKISISFEGEQLSSNKDFHVYLTVLKMLDEQQGRPDGRGFIVDIRDILRGMGYSPKRIDSKSKKMLFDSLDRLRNNELVITISDQPKKESVEKSDFRVIDGSKAQKYEMPMLDCKIRKSDGSCKIVNYSDLCGLYKNLHFRAIDTDFFNVIKGDLAKAIFIELESRVNNSIAVTSTVLKKDYILSRFNGFSYSEKNRKHFWKNFRAALKSLMKVEYPDKSIGAAICSFSEGSRDRFEIGVYSKDEREKLRISSKSI